MSTEIAILNPTYGVGEAVTLQLLTKAFSSTMVNLTTDHQLKDRLLLAMGGAFLESGIKPPETLNELNIMADGIIKRLRKQQTNIRIDEIEIAFSDGVHKKWGQYYGLNIVSFCDFIYNHVKDSERIEALRVKNLPPAPKIPNQAKRFRTAKKNALRGYMLSLKEESVGFYGSSIFDFFFKIKLFVIEQAEIDSLYDKAKIFYLEYLATQKNSIKDALKRKEWETQFNEFMHLAQNDGEKAKSIGSVTAIAKRLFIDNLYNGFKFDEITIQNLITLINQHKPF